MNPIPLDQAADTVPGWQPAGDLDLSAARTAIDDWLLNSTVQIREGSETGAVAGWTSESQPAFCYPEITGYYLTYLAYLPVIGKTASLHARKEAAAAWLSRVLSAPGPPTRIYRGRSVADWRNRHLFSFDLSMIFRGALLAGVSAVARRAVELLRQFVSEDGELAPATGCKADSGNRWSLRPGFYQLKAAAVITSGTTEAEDSMLRAAAQSTIETQTNHLQRYGFEGEPHGFLYGIEGLLLHGGPGIDLAARAFAALLSSEGIPYAQRSDTVAQTLRAGSVLRALGALDSSWEATLAILAQELLTLQHPSGAMRFSLTGEGRRHENAWSSMFASQALWAYENLNSPGMPGLLLSVLV